jgi:hypothetical protein
MPELPEIAHQAFLEGQGTANLKKLTLDDE